MWSRSYHLTKEASRFIIASAPGTRSSRPDRTWSRRTPGRVEANRSASCETCPSIERGRLTTSHRLDHRNPRARAPGGDRRENRDRASLE